jgi:hypothetical protein
MDGQATVRLTSLRWGVWTAAFGIWLIAVAAVLSIPQVNAAVFPSALEATTGTTGQTAQPIPVRVVGEVSVSGDVKIERSIGARPLQVELYCGERFSTEPAGSFGCPLWVTVP